MHSLRGRISAPPSHCRVRSEATSRHVATRPGSKININKGAISGQFLNCPIAWLSRYILNSWVINNQTSTMFTLTLIGRKCCCPILKSKQSLFMLKILMEDRQLMWVKMWRLLAEVWAAGALSVGNYAVLYNVQCNNIIDTSRTASVNT